MKNKRIMLKIYSLSQIMLETMDSLENCEEYKRELKMRTNRYKLFLEDHTKKNMNELFKIDDELMGHISKASEAIVDKSIEDIVLEAEL